MYIVFHILILYLLIFVFTFPPTSMVVFVIVNRQLLQYLKAYQRANGTRSIRHMHDTCEQARNL